MPGERSGRTEAQRRKSGIPIPPKLWEELEKIAKDKAIKGPAFLELRISAQPQPDQPIECGVVGE